jgi:hypothetical protein
MYQIIMDEYLIVVGVSVTIAAWMLLIYGLIKNRVERRGHHVTKLD